MPDIAKINAVAIADIEKVDGILAANIEKVNGLTFSTAPAFTGLLDETYGSGAAAAYSVRRLASATTVLLRVRRDTAGGTGDDDEADVAYDSNNILSLDSAISNASALVTATTLGQFLNVGTVGGTTYTNPDSLTVTASCLVNTWMDQSGNGNDAEQTTQGSQPQIHNGTADTDLILENGKPALETSGGEMLITSSLSVNFQNQSVFICANSDSSGYSTILEYSDDAGTGNRAVWVGVNNASPEKFGSAAYNGQLVFGGDATSQFLGAFIGVNGGNSTVYVDGSQVASATTSTYKSSTGPIQLLRNQETTSRFPFVGTLQECILYASNESDNRSDIEENINSDFLIYQPTDAPTSGLLATYTGAAAAYSVRQLSDKAVIALRIRRDSDDEETNIGFDSNGDLATADISAFCGTANGYVTRWWDQSTNGNHADQATDASQPQIYNGTAVVTENGKPAISNWQSATTILISSFGTTYNNVHLFSVSRDDAGSAALGYIVSGNTSTNLRLARNTADSDIFLYDGVSAYSTTAQATGQALISASNETTPTVFYNSSSRSFNNTLNGNGMSGAYIGNHPALANGANLDGNLQELIIFSAHQSSTNRTGIETNINDYFDIY